MSEKVLIDLGSRRDVTLNEIKRLKVKIITEYHNSVIADILPRQKQRLRDQRIKVAPYSKRSIRVNGVRIDRQTVEKLPAALSSKSKGRSESGYYILALAGPVMPDWKRGILAAGAEVVQSLPDYGLVIKGMPSAVEAVRRLDYVAWISHYSPGFKLSPHLFGIPARSITPPKMRLENITPERLPYGEVEISFFKGEDPKSAIPNIEAAGGKITAQGRNRLRVRILPKDLDKLAAIEAIRRIDSYEPEEYDNDICRGILHVPEVESSNELDGDGQIVSVMDSGLDTGVDDATMHQDFQGRIEALVPVAGRTDAEDNDSGHGTHVCGTALGDGSESTGQYAGIAPVARIIMLAKPASMPTANDMTDAFDEANDRDSRIVNNSWGKSSDAAYDGWSEAIDEYVWEHRDFLPMFSAGNSGRDNDADGVADLGSLRRTGAAKNCLCVGGSENDRPSGSVPTPGRDFNYSAYGEPTVDPIDSDHFSDDPDGMFYHSSRGPTDDGRIKPDVVAPATNLLSTRSSIAADPDGELMDAADPLYDLYQWMTGTSMSTPAVTGCVALSRQYLIQQRGHERTDDFPRPSAALLKALIINGAVDMPGQYISDETGSIPNPNEGWGRADINASLFPPTTARVQFSDAPEYALATGETRSFHAHVHDSSEPLKVTLVWSDAPGSGVVNQLYLRVETPTGVMHDGDFNDDGSASPYDDVAVNGVQNNVQQVTVDAPELGQYTFHVIAVSITEGIDPSPRSDLPADTPVQDFALVASNCTGYSKQPVALMQVIDRSGSMGYYGYMEPARLRAMEMVDVLQINDKTGVVSFNQTASLDYGLSIISSYDDKEDVKDAIQPLVSDGTTSIGAGVELAQAQFSEDGLPHAIVLLSDGFSNTAPYAIDPPDGSDPIVDGAFIDTGTVIYTVALGPTADTGRLEDIAAATSGQFYQINGYSDVHSLHEIYYNIQALALGDEIVELDSDEIGSGGGDSNIDADTSSGTKRHTAEIDNYTKEAFFALSTDKEDDNLQLKLEDPYGHIIHPYSSRAIFRQGNGFRFYRVALPVPGTWHLLVNADPKKSDDTESTKYTVAVLCDSTIDMDCSFVGKPQVGKDLTIEISLTQDGKPISTAKVVAGISKLAVPLEELKKRYAKQLKEIQLDEKATAGDDKTLARLAVLDRQLADQKKEPIFATKTEYITLNPSRKGVYTATLPKSKVPESYSVRIDAKGVVGTDPHIGFTRTATFGFNISPKERPQLDFSIKDLIVLPNVWKRPGTVRYDSLFRSCSMIGIIVVDSDGTPSTPREGTSVDITIKHSKSKTMTIKDVPYSKHLGFFVARVKGITGVVEVTARATRDGISKTRIETLKLRR